MDFLIYFFKSPSYYAAYKKHSMGNIYSIYRPGHTSEGLHQNHTDNYNVCQNTSEVLD